MEHGDRLSNFGFVFWTWGRKFFFEFLARERLSCKEQAVDVANS